MEHWFWRVGLLLLLSTIPVCAGECSESQFSIVGAHFDKAVKTATADFVSPRFQEMGVLYSCRYDTVADRYTVKGKYSFRDNQNTAYWMDLWVSFNGDGGNLEYGPADALGKGWMLRLAGILGIVFGALFVLGSLGCC